MSSAANIIRLAELRQTLAERFPTEAPAAERVWATGWAALDAQAGGLRLGTVTELSGSGGCGTLFLHRLLGAVRQQQRLAALVDCGRSFDPESYREVGLERLLCVFCDTPELGVKAVDLLLRDGNLPLVFLDLQALPARSRGRIPASTWHRFQRLVEKSGTALIVLTPQPMVEAARVRIAVRNRWSLAALRRRRRELLDELSVQVFHRGRQATPGVEPLVRTA